MATQSQFWLAISEIACMGITQMYCPGVQTTSLLRGSVGMPPSRKFQEMNSKIAKFNWFLQYQVYYPTSYFESFIMNYARLLTLTTYILTEHRLSGQSVLSHEKAALIPNITLPLYKAQNALLSFSPAGKHHSQLLRLSVQWSLSTKTHNQ